MRASECLHSCGNSLANVARPPGRLKWSEEEEEKEESCRTSTQRSYAEDVEAAV
jgi:hypothetical protein